MVPKIRTDALMHGNRRKRRNGMGPLFLRKRTDQTTGSGAGIRAPNPPGGNGTRPGIARRAPGGCRGAAIDSRAGEGPPGAGTTDSTLGRRAHDIHPGAAGWEPTLAPRGFMGTATDLAKSRMGPPLGEGMGVKVCGADHKLLETQSTPPTLDGGVTGCCGVILTPMLGEGGLWLRNSRPCLHSVDARTRGPGGWWARAAGGGDLMARRGRHGARSTPGEHARTRTRRQKRAENSKGFDGKRKGCHLATIGSGR